MVEGAGAQELNHLSAITTGLFIMKVWVTGRMMKSLIPSTIVRPTATFPSSAPGISAE
jgi:hypothetical protein